MKTYFGPKDKTSVTIRWKLFLSILALSLTAACITINVYFPEAAVKDLSQKIEDAVAEEAVRAAGEDASGSDAAGTSASHGLVQADSPARLAAWTTPTPALSQVSAPGASVRAAVLPLLLRLTASSVEATEVADPAVTNPAIRKIIESRGARLPQILPFKKSGVLGENKDALLEIRNLGSLALRDRAVAQRLVKDENSDRERMFKEIAAATGADLSSLPQIQATYAETLREKAAAGDWIQMADGSWKQK